VRNNSTQQIRFQDNQPIDSTIPNKEGRTFSKEQAIKAYNKTAATK